MAINKQAVLNLGRVGLFIGIESYKWTGTDWTNAAHFMIDHGIDFAIVKVFDGPNDWFPNFSEFQSIARVFTSGGIAVLPYGFMYGYDAGSNLATELGLAAKYANGYGIVCGDIEGTRWANHADWGLQVNEFITNSSDFNGIFTASVPANPVDANQVVSFAPFASAVSGFMPMAYNDYLASQYMGQYDAIAHNLPLMPTFDLSQEFGSNNVYANASAAASLQQISLWEYQFAVANPTLVDQIVSLMKVNKNMVQLTSTGEVAQFVSDVDQFVGGLSVEECVAYTDSLIWHSTQPGTPNSYTANDVSVMAQQYYATETGSDTANVGLSVAQEEDILQRMGLNYVVLQNTIDAVKAMVERGLPVALCGAENGFYRVTSNGSEQVPYTWQPTGNHCITVSGLAPSGNFYVRDTAALSDNTIPASQQEYDNSKMQIVSAIAVIPTWIKGNVMSGLPTGAIDTGTEITFAGSPYVIKSGFYSLYKELATNGLIPEDDSPFNNEYGCNPVENSNPSWWGGGGTAQETRYFRFGWSAAQGVHATYIGQEFLWYKAQYESQLSEIATLNTNITNLTAQLAAATKPVEDTALVADIAKLEADAAPVAADVAAIQQEVSTQGWTNNAVG